MSEQIKPVAWMCDANDGANADATTSERVRDDYERFGRTITPLYAIPGTHRIVPVEDLKNVAEMLDFWINRADTRNMSESEYKTWLALGHQSKTVIRLRAIIDKEQS